MSEWTGLPLNTPTVIEDTAEFQRIATRTANGGTVQVVAKAGSAMAAAQTAEANAATVKAGLAGFFADADAAQTTITNLLASASPGAGTLTTAQLSTAVRALDTALRQVATIERGVIRRAVALVRLTTNALDTTDGTT
jgi:hypothetical protein